MWRKKPQLDTIQGYLNKPVNLKEINPEYSLKGLMLKLNLILWPPDVKSQPTGKDPDAGKD